MEGQSKYDGLLEAQAPIREFSEKIEAAQERAISDFLKTHSEYGGESRDVLRAFYQELERSKKLAEDGTRYNTRKFLGINSESEEA